MRKMQYNGTAYNLVQSGNGGLRYFEAYFCTYFDTYKTGKYITSFIYPQSQISMFDKLESPTFRDFVFITADRVNDLFGVELLKIIEFSKLDFEAIKGVEIKEDFSLFPKYELKEKFQSFNKCFL